MHIKGENRGQAKLFPGRLDELIAEWLASLVTSVEKEVMVADEEPGRSRAALAALETEREDLTARITEMQQGLRAQTDTDSDGRPRCVNILTLFFGSEFELVNLPVNQGHPFVPTHGVRGENQSDSHTRILVRGPVVDNRRLFLDVDPQLIIPTS